MLLFVENGGTAASKIHDLHFKASQQLLIGPWMMVMRSVTRIKMAPSLKMAQLASHATKR